MTHNYRIKPRPVYALQYNGFNGAAITELIGPNVSVVKNLKAPGTGEITSVPQCLVIPQPGGQIQVSIGDWIVKNDKEQLIVYDNATFTFIFEPI